MGKNPRFSLSLKGADGLTLMQPKCNITTIKMKPDIIILKTVKPVMEERAMAII